MKKIYLIVLGAILFSFTSNAQVVINEIYGGGGNSGATYKNDFIELYNNSSSPVSLAGWSVQYASATGTTWSVTNLTGSIPANGYYLIQEAVGAGGTVNLPTPDATGTIAMSATAGKVILVNVTTAQTGSNPTGSQIIDKVGFGATANAFEGTGPTPAPSNTTSVQRSPVGNDTGNNNTDFGAAGAPSPNNSTGASDVTPPAISTLFPANGATNINTSFTASITFNEAIQKGATGSIIIKKLSDNSTVQTIDVTTSAVTVSGSTSTFNVAALSLNNSYYIEISSGAFKDIASNNFPGITGSSTWNFTTSATPPQGSLNTTYNFNVCGSNLPDNFTQFSETGTLTWACSNFGRDAANPPSGNTPFGVEMNGFSSGSNIANVDWFISPSFDLTGTTYPLLSFWSRTAFNGLPLQLKVSTDYTGGNPAAATWVDVNGKFPGLASNIWTLSNNINLSAFKQSNVHFAFVYTSSDDEGARWTLDDIRIDNSSTPPPPSLTVGTTDIQFPFVAGGSSSNKTFSFTGNDITTDVTITVTGSAFTISKDGTSFGSSITYTQAEANNTAKTVTVRFSPSQPEQNYTGTVNVSTSSLSAAVNLKGTSVDPANTLEVVNWNIEWFGSPDLGPPNNTLQEQNVKTVLQNVGADIYGLLEVVDESRLANIVSQMPGYSYVISNYGSHTNTSANPPSALAAAQKMAFVYRTSVFSNITTTALLSQGINSAADLTNPAYNYFASGRFPFMMSADVTLNGVTKNVKFVLIHAKANTSPTDVSYTRRKNGSDTLNYTLNLNYPNDNIVFFGDLNDDLDVSITAGQTVTSYVAFTNDNSHFYAPTLALSQAGKKSTVSYNDVIDHVILSNEMQNYYIPSSANILTDVASTITNYGSTTTDHYPVFTRYSFAPANIPLPVKLITFNAVKDNSKVKLTWSTSSEVNAKEFAVEKSTDGRNFQLMGTVHAAGNSSNTVNYSFNDAQPNSGNNYYRLRVIDQDNRSELSKILRIDFSRPYTFSVSPNPARSVIVVTLTNASQGLLEVVDMNGRVLKSQTITTLDNKVDVSNLSKGIYLVRLKGPQAIYSEKLVIE